jgi:hypothetical protein
MHAERMRKEGKKEGEGRREGGEGRREGGEGRREGGSRMSSCVFILQIFSSQVLQLSVVLKKQTHSVI